MTYGSTDLDVEGVDTQILAALSDLWKSIVLVILYETIYPDVTALTSCAASMAA